MISGDSTVSSPSQCHLLPGARVRMAPKVLEWDLLPIKASDIIMGRESNTLAIK